MNTNRYTKLVVALACLSSASIQTALAQGEAPTASTSAAVEAPATVEAPPAELAPPEAPPAAKPPPPPYSLPFALRPVAAANVVRSDTALAFFKDPATDKAGSTLVTMLLGSVKVTDEFGVMLRLGLVSNTPPDTAMDPGPGAGFLNPVLGFTYGLKLGNVRIAPFLGIALPLGSGGGDAPQPKQVLARNAGIWARSAMDNAMFAVNDLVIFPGVGFAYIGAGFTAQAEITILQLTRVRGNDMVQPDSSRTNLTAGVHLGYFFIPALSLGAEVRHQRWLSTPGAVKANDELRDTTTVAAGPRVHLKLGEKTWLRPGISVALPLDRPMTDSKYATIQLDIPIIF
jgi:hypothetical protein